MPLSIDRTRVAEYPSRSGLLAMGLMGSDGDDASAFQPVAFRTVLTLAMTMAVADAQGLPGRREARARLGSRMGRAARGRVSRMVPRGRVKGRASSLIG